MRRSPVDESKRNPPSLRLYHLIIVGGPSQTADGGGFILFFSLSIPSQRLLASSQGIERVREKERMNPASIPLVFFFSLTTLWSWLAFKREREKV